MKAASLFQRRPVRSDDRSTPSAWSRASEFLGRRSTAAGDRTTVRPSLPSRLPPLTKREALDTVQEGLLTVFPRDRIKGLVNAADLSANGAKKLLGGDNLPGLVTAANIARAVGEDFYPTIYKLFGLPPSTPLPGPIAAEITRLVSMEQQLDPDFQRALSAFLQAYVAGRR